MFGIGTQEIIVIVLLVLLFFGGRKIPELMKGLGRGVRSFREGVNGVADEEKKDAAQADDKKKKENDAEK